MHIHLIRHGQTNANVEKLSSCSADEPLNQTGLLQAEQLAMVLPSYGFTDLWCCPFKRARQTLAPFLQTSEISPVFQPSLCEGRFNLDAKAPISDPTYDPATGLPMNEDSISSFRGRVSEFLQMARCLPEDSRLLVLTHGHYIRETLNFLLGATSYARFPVANCSETHLEIGQHLFIHKVNKELV